MTDEVGVADRQSGAEVGVNGKLPEQQEGRRADCDIGDAQDDELVKQN